MYKTIYHEKEETQELSFSLSEEEDEELSSSLSEEEQDDGLGFSRPQHDEESEDEDIEEEEDIDDEEEVEEAGVEEEEAEEEDEDGEEEVVNDETDGENDIEVGEVEFEERNVMVHSPVESHSPNVDDIVVVNEDNESNEVGDANVAEENDENIDVENVDDHDDFMEDRRIIEASTSTLSKDNSRHGKEENTGNDIDDNSPGSPSGQHSPPHGNLSLPPGSIQSSQLYGGPVYISPLSPSYSTGHYTPTAPRYGVQQGSGVSRRLNSPDYSPSSPRMSPSYSPSSDPENDDEDDDVRRIIEASLQLQNNSGRGEEENKDFVGAISFEENSLLRQDILTRYNMAPTPVNEQSPRYSPQSPSYSAPRFLSPSYSPPPGDDEVSPSSEARPVGHFSFPGAYSPPPPGLSPSAKTVKLSSSPGGDEDTTKDDHDYDDNGRRDIDEESTCSPPRSTLSPPPASGDSNNSSLCQVRTDIFKSPESKRMDAAAFMIMEPPDDPQEDSPFVFDSGFKDTDGGGRRGSSSSSFSNSSHFLPPSSESIENFVREYSLSSELSRGTSEESGFIKTCHSPQSSSSPRSASPMTRSLTPVVSTPRDHDDQEPGTEDNDDDGGHDDLRCMLRKRKHEDCVLDRNKLAAMLAAKDLEILLENQRALTQLCDERKELKLQIDEVDKRKAELAKQDKELFTQIFKLKKTIKENEANLAKSKEVCAKAVAKDNDKSTEPPPAKVQVTCKMTPVKVKQEIEETSSSTRNFVSKKIILEGGSNFKLSVPTSQSTAKSQRQQKDFERLLENNHCCKEGHGFYCDLCNVKALNEKMIRQHIDGKRHGESLYRERYQSDSGDLRSILRNRRRR